MILLTSQLRYRRFFIPPNLSVLMTTTIKLTPGVIDRNHAYSVREFRRRTGLGDYAYAQARKAGLRVIKVGKKPYVLGSDWLDFLSRCASGEAECAE